MKTIKLFITLLVFGLTISKSIAQVTQAVNTATQNKEWQFSVRAGYDHPLFDEDFKYIDYKGGLMAGFSANHYWNWFGLQADFDYMNNSPIADGLDGARYFVGNTVLRYSDILTQKENIKRMFVGIGPAFRYLNQSKKFQAELSLLGGMGFVNGGEILVEGKRQDGTQEALTYHSGFDNVSLFTGKAQARFTYFFSNNWGINAGAYYMKHFGGAEESTKNTILKASSYGAGLNHPVYYGEINSFITQAFENGVGGTYEAFGEGIKIRDFQQGEEDMRRKIDLASAGVFIGLTYRIAPAPKVKKAIVEEKVVEKPAPVEKKYCLQVTAKDMYTKEILPNTDVALKNSKGEVVGTAKTDAFGVTKFCDILPDDYTIAGVLNEVPLQGNVAKKSEFNNGVTLQKDILYTDRNFIVKGKAFECNSTTPISGINVVLENTDKAFKKTTTTDANGNFMLQLPEEGTYSLYGRKESYFSQTETVTASNYSREKNLFVKLEICAEKADCGKGLGLKNILFDLDKYAIKDIAKPELNRLVRFMQDNPEIKVEVGSHTDCRSSATYNQKLSQNRANASVDYVVSQGISRDRITGKGYGESKLLNECADGVNCSEDKHSINRRTEMKVICPDKK
jgi:outer membrane protein OmpA-like peptidoglycan-associated protein